MCCALLCAILVFTCPMTALALRVSEIERVAEDYNVSEDFLDEIWGESKISVSEFKNYAVEYQLPAQFVQRFVSDSFVFKQGKQFQYIPVDESLPMNDYNWDYLNDYTFEKTYEVDGAIKSIKGIDVSVHQGNINWDRVRNDGVEFVFIRLGYRGYTEGKLYVDKNFHKNIQGAQAAGLKVGVYFYSQAVTVNEAVNEANLVLRELEGYDLDYPVAFDIEGAPARNARTVGMSVQRATDIVNAFCGTIKESGYTPILYTYAKYMIESLDLSQLTQYDTWMAQYYKVPFYPYQMACWQYTGTGRVDGISTHVDLNIAFKDLSV